MSFPFACVFKTEISTKLFQRKGFSSKLGPSKRNKIGMCGQKSFTPQKVAPIFSTSKRLSDFHGKMKKFPFLQNFNFKPHDENCLSLCVVPLQEDAFENNGHEQARLFVKSLDASFRNTWR